MASPAFAGSPVNVKLETGSSAATPRPAPGTSLTVPTTAQPSRATTPRMPGGAETASQDLASSARPAQPPSKVSLFDPTHIPSVYGRIQTLSKLIIAASADAHSLAVPRAGTTGEKQEPEEGQAGQSTNTGDGAQAAAASSDSIAPPLGTPNDGPNIALGASTDDDVNSGYEAALFLSAGNDEARDRNVQPTALAEALVHESVGLRDAFARAQQAIGSLEGGDMDIEEQEHLIELLSQYSEQQR